MWTIDGRIALIASIGSTASHDRFDGVIDELPATLSHAVIQPSHEIDREGSRTLECPSALVESTVFQANRGGCRENQLASLEPTTSVGVAV
jgi:hypothetical protein